MKQNKNFPFTLLHDASETITNTQYSITRSGDRVPLSTLSSDSKFPFEALEWESAGSLYFGKIKYYNESKELDDLPLDMIVNKTALTNIAKFINSQNKDEVYQSYYRKINHEDNFYKVLKYLKQINSRSTVLYDAYNTVGVDLLHQNKYFELYNDTCKIDTNTYVCYCENIYRSRGYDFFNIILNNDKLYSSLSRKNIKLGMFTCTTNNSNLMFYLKIRNFNIPMKRVLVSKKVSDGTTEYTFTFIYPEYILKTTKNYFDAVKYIHTNNTSTASTYIKLIEYTPIQGTQSNWVQSSTYVNKLIATNNNISYEISSNI